MPEPESELSSGAVEHVARLARLGITPEEVVRYRDQLRNILAHIAALNKADTSRVPATAHPLEERNVMRDDTVTPSLDPEAVWKNAPSRQEAYFKVKAIQE